jgi:hypothetical protein
LNEHATNGTSTTGARSMAAAARTTAYLTSFGGRPSPVQLPPSSKRHHNSVVFMENDARLYSSRAALGADVAATFGPRMDLAMGYRAEPPWPQRSLGSWQRLSYVNDPLADFARFPASRPLRSDGVVAGVAFFSSQCDPGLAAARLRIVEALVPALAAQRIPFASFGKCFHSADLATALPHCAALPRSHARPRRRRPFCRAAVL